MNGTRNSLYAWVEQVWQTWWVVEHPFDWLKSVDEEKACDSFVVQEWRSNRASFFREKFSFRTAAKEKSPGEEIRLPSNSNEHVQ